ncbi:MAG: DUF4388 domain-containing protein [Acidobacteriota bacterium]
MNTIFSSDDIYPAEFARIEGLSVPQIIHSVCKSRVTGVLHFIRGEAIKSLYIREGSIIFASSSEWSDRLGGILLQKGKIRYSHLEDAIQKLGKGKRIGTILADSSAMNTEDVVEGVIDQVKNIIFSVFNWDSGAYRFVDGELPTNELITLNLSTFEIILQGVQRITDFKILLRSLGSLKKKFMLSPQYEVETYSHFLLAEQETIVDKLRNPSSVEEIQEQTGLDTLFVVKTMVALKLLDLIEEESSPVLKAFLRGGGFRGNLETLDIIDLFGRLITSRQSGTLYLHGESLQVGLRLKEGKLLSIYIPDEDVSFLYFLAFKGGKERVSFLRRISEFSKDDSECGRAIEEEFAREEIQQEQKKFASTIISDVMKLEKGEFTFLDEEPPAPGIPVDIALENLIMDYMYHIGSWPRVRRGCGELDTILRITAAYLDIMDRITVSKVLWDIVSRLHNPSTVQEILSSFEMKEFEMCRLLWVLQVLGVIRRVEASEIEVEQPALSATKKKEETVKLESGIEHAIEAIPWKREGDLEGEEDNEIGWAKEGKKEEEAKAETEQERAMKIGENAGVVEEAEAGKEEIPEEEIEIDEAILDDIEKFNEKQRYLFEKIRAEMGAGARNFINYCRNKVGDALKNPFIDLNITQIGEWDAKALAKRIVQNEIDDYRSGFDMLLAAELDMVGKLISRRKQEELGRGLKEIEKRQVEIE